MLRNAVTSKQVHAVVSRWKRILAVGCSHGPHLDPLARDAVLKFSELWKPEIRIHLGDFCDTAAFRNGSQGTNDEHEPVGPDIDHGLKFLQELRPTLVFCGNHEARLWSKAKHHNAVIAECAQHVIERIETRCALLKAELVPYNIHNGWREIGGVKYLHGFMFNEMACRDHAESFGTCVFAHTHKAGMQRGRRVDGAVGYCVGTLTKISNMDYAATRRSTLAWSQGFVFGETNGKETQLWLSEKQTKEWKLPN